MERLHPLAWQIIKFFKNDLKVFGRSDESFVHQFAYRYSAIVYIICFIMYSLTFFLIEQSINDYTGMHCLYPKEISDQETQQFSLLYCWSSYTYYIPSDTSLPTRGEVKNNRITYYQWVPWILIICSILAIGPFKAWRYFIKASYFDLEQIMKDVIDIKTKEAGQDKQIKTKHLTDSITTSMKHYYDYRRSLGNFGKSLASNKLVISYIITRCLYLFTTFTLFCLLNVLLGQNLYSFYGIIVIGSILKNNLNTFEFSLFPRITMCDVPIRSTGHNINWYVVQCVLPINFFNEKIFLILWFWNAFVFLGTVISTLIWFLGYFMRSKESMKKYLEIVLCGEKKPKKIAIDIFINDALTADFIFVLDIIRKKGSHEIVSEILISLWENFCPDSEIKPKNRNSQSVNRQNTENVEEESTRFVS